MTSTSYSRGHITYGGTLPNIGFAAALLRWLVPQPSTPWHPATPSVTATSATATDGRRVHFPHNWSWEPAVAQPIVPLADLLTGTSFPAGARVQLGAGAVRVFVEIH
ncbi:hypothetical protein Ade02nite_81850 [Paractinoplanes deccanensis]|uniref:Uncharacterized protein n=1 Tax=Paractinoplanes deccanensis TaxID=113561 RepID=A0ABQ3YHQ1_9ACTN|nr:hypothetical protein [Actinoplanes deccanensis]GID79544.1 hypothetical protein Ade02nite_81850 [Actinoplanes deccanensis]